MAAVAIQLLQKIPKVATGIYIALVDCLKSTEPMAFDDYRRALFVGQITIVANLLTGC